MSQSPNEVKPDEVQIPHPLKFTVDEIKEYIEKGADLRVRDTFSAFLDAMGALNFQNQALMNENFGFGAALALILHEKFAPLRVRQSDIEKLPKGWSVNLQGTPDPNMFHVVYTSPVAQPSKILILPK